MQGVSDRRQHGSLLLLLAMAAACAGTDRSRSSSGPLIDNQQAHGTSIPHAKHCPVTAPLSRSALPTVLERASGRWYGDDFLWVALPDYPATRRADGFFLKYPWVILHDGAPTSQAGPPQVVARRIDGTGHSTATSAGYASSAEPPYRFWPSGLSLSAPGCWEVTGSIHNSTLRFTLYVPPP